MTTPRSRAALLPLPLTMAAAIALTGCGRTMTDDDCKRVADNMLSVWQTEAKKSAPESGPGVEKAAAVIKAEGDKLVGDWSAECKKELVDRRVDPRELDCLLGAKSIEQLNKCAEL
jgi:hypothetical protein